MSIRRDASRQALSQDAASTAVLSRFREDVESVCRNVENTTISSVPRIFKGDSRVLHLVKDVDGAGLGKYDVVVTSPPYPNRMSYVRELRPYMYWLGFLETAEEAGDLDWRAIGGTWGRATSNLSRWSLERTWPLPAGPLTDAVDQILDRHLVLGRYVQKYIADTAQHLESLAPLLADGARVSYIVGNSRFFDTMLPTELIYAELFKRIGLADIEIIPLRRRTSKKELWEFAVTGRR